MKCTNCGMRDATTQVTLKNGSHIEKLYLCNVCADNYRPEVDFDSFDVLDKLMNGSPMGLLSNLNGFFDTPTTRAIVCPDCKTSGAEFLKTGFVGCSKCYRAFEPLIVQTVKKLQQSDRHIGKKPIGEEGISSEESRLKAELQAAVDSGDYSKIGELGDRLKKLVANKMEGK